MGLVGQLGKKPKLSTLWKSKMDWDSFKTTQGITEELQQHNKDGLVVHAVGQRVSPYTSFFIFIFLDIWRSRTSWPEQTGDSLNGRKRFVYNQQRNSPDMLLLVCRNLFLSVCWSRY